METTLIALYCLVDDFCQQFQPYWHKTLLQTGLKKRARNAQLSPSEIMAIYIHFHQSHYRDFKHYYTQHVCQYLTHLFPKVVQQFSL